MTRSYYIVSKPLQYFNAININDVVINKTCIIIDSFYEAQGFFKRIKNQNYWSNVLFFDNQLDAYKWLNKEVNLTDYLFIDSDYGLQKTLWLSRIKSINIYVYEEGIGSYRNDLLKSGHQKKIILFFLKLIGVKGYMGGGRYTKGIIIYNIEKHKKLIRNFRNERVQFKLSFLDHIVTDPVKKSFNIDSTQPIFQKLTNKKIFLYLTDFKYNDEINFLLTKYSDYTKILKPHPFQKDKVDNNKFDFIIENGILIELFIIESLKIVNELVVVHENSSAIEYFKQVKNITLIDIKV